MNRLDASAGYSFNRNWQLRGGVPVYFVRPSETVSTTTEAKSANALGNVYLQGVYLNSSEDWGYMSSLTVTAPTGDREAGLTTGRVTVDWTHYGEFRTGRLVPFGSAGIANAVSDTMIFTRPYTSLGLTTHFEGGMRVQAARWFEVGASAYAIVPGGEQTVYSRVSRRGRAAQRAQGRPFDGESVTIGPADIARDHGASTWIRLPVTESFDLFGGYTRSIRFGLNMAFFGIGINFGRSSRP